MNPTYTIQRRPRVDHDVPHPGVSRFDDHDDGRIYASYYNWVGFVLFFQALLFYLPRFFWKSLEAGKINTLVKDIDGGSKSEAEKKEKQEMVLDYLHANLKSHN